jgi:hypothetical protein
MVRQRLQSGCRPQQDVEHRRQEQADHDECKAERQRFSGDPLSGGLRLSR